jgi:hypothetical protein
VPGGFGHHALRYYGRGGRCCPCTGLASRRVTPAARTSQEAWPGAESGGQSPDESRSGAPEGERAPQAESLRKQRILWRASAPNADKRRSLRTLVCAADNGSIASFGAPLPSLLFARAVEFLNWRGGRKARTRTRRENGYVCPRPRSCPGRGAARQRCTAEPGPSQARRLRRSRVCSATLACRAAAGKREHGGRRSR